ncbi:glycosyltransferase family 2 protein [Methylomonas koyamae]|uniref:glycosyltransferase family 2 protein n=1 Tax=Methylomonas koyamae TaxID=702114 RepID=UPI0006CFA534|nr:glycosyltransferase [Methylomonas koyamae]BBL58708.1 hypothetical protein MKFW12EY_23210 [Methylomonas koyamae]
MKISAVIPAYNSAKFIKAAIASIEAQTEPVAEIIIVDDGSTDATEAVVHSLPGNIVYYKQANQGPSAARNKGMELATGDWIAFLDADDQWTENKIALQKTILEKYPELVLVAGDMTEIDNDDDIITESVLAKHGMLEDFRELAGQAIPNALARLVTKNFIPTGTVLAKRDILIAAGGFNSAIRFGEDLELWAKIATHHPISCLSLCLMLRRQHGNNATSANESMLLDLTKVMESVRAFSQQQLKRQGLDPNQLVSDAFWNLGYWYFVNNQANLARKAFISSLKQQLTSRSVAYLIASTLPSFLVAQLRKFKQIIG